MKTYICSLVVTILVSSACDGETRLTSPTSPNTPPVSSPITLTLTGIVTEMTPSGPAPLEGASVQFTGSSEQAVTDGDGLYTLSGVWATPRTSRGIAASMPGYTTLYAVVFGNADDTRRDFQLQRFATYTLSGVVFEMTESGRVPIEGVEVYCDGCGSPVGHTFEYTDANGRYRFEWTPNGATPLWVTKEGYALANNQPLGPRPGYIVPTVQGDTRFDIELVRR